jgi:hypothetical protein
MKKLVLSFALIVIALSNTFALSGGPDLFGYTWKDSNEPGGPVYSWVDIVISGKTIVGLADDNFRGPFTISHSGPSYFRFYWLQMDEFWVGSNGYISFGNILLASPFPGIPDSTDTRHNFISGLLGDLTFQGVGNPGQCYYEDNADSLIVSYLNVPFYSANYPYWSGSNTFQIILNKLDFSITVNFKSQSGTSTDGDVRTGIENLTGVIGLQPFAYSYPVANYSIRYYYPTNPTYFVTDGSAEWNSWDGSGGLFIPYPGAMDLKSKVANSGNLKIPPTYTSTAKVKNFTGSTLLTDAVGITDTLFVFGDSIIDYIPDFIPPSTGIYSFISTISGISSDNIQSNDSVIQEVVAIDTSLYTLLLNYSDNVPDYPGLSWVDGTGGIGVYFVPPYYPCLITATNFFIESNASGATFIGKIYDDDGYNHGPGTLLDSVMYTNPVFVGGYNTIIPINDVVVYDSGVYIAWEMYGLNITLARDLTPPISRRTFEYVGGAWSEYRDNQSEDFLITCMIQKHQIEDVGTTRINTPISDTISNPATVSVWVKNFGAMVENNFIVKYKAWTHSVVSENYTGPALNPGDSALFTFATTLFDTANVYGSICVWTTKSNDYDPHNDTTCSQLQVIHGLSIPEVEKTSGISVYPNPTNNTACIYFDNPVHKLYQLRVYDAYGKLAYAKNDISGEKVFLTREMLAPGMYIIELFGEHILHARLIMQ